MLLQICFNHKKKKKLKKKIKKIKKKKKKKILKKKKKKNIKDNGTFFLFWFTNSFNNLFSYNAHIMR